MSDPLEEPVSDPLEQVEGRLEFYAGDKQPKQAHRRPHWRTALLNLKIRRRVSELVKGGAAKTQAVEQAANELGRSVEAVWKACKRRLRPTDMELWAQAKEALDAARERRESQRTGKDT